MVRRTAVVVVASLILAAFAQGIPEWWASWLQGSSVLVLLYLAADPVASAATNPGRWLYGALVGGLTVLFSTVGPGFGALPKAGAGLSELFDPTDVDALVALLRRHLDDPAHHAARRAAAVGYQGPSWSDTARAVATAIGGLAGTGTGAH